MLPSISSICLEGCLIECLLLSCLSSKFTPSTADGSSELRDHAAVFLPENFG